MLAVGGMGQVWLAHHVDLNTPVAVKLMASTVSLEAAALLRFRREARAAARLRTPHVVTVHDFGEDAGTPYLVMEFLEGETLQQLLVREGRISAARASEFLNQACAALAVAHAHGIVHRDIKPSNLFLARTSAGTVLKVLDFGIVHAALDDENTAVTRSGTILGSPAYMSPEQANADSIGPESDLWSVAAVVYRMLTGREPFTALTVRDTLARIRAGRFTAPSALLDQAPRALDEFFARAFQVNPSARFETAAAFSAAFGAIAIDSPPVVVPVPRDNTTRDLVLPKRARRVAALLALAATVVFLVARWSLLPLTAARPSVDSSKHDRPVTQLDTAEFRRHARAPIGAAEPPPLESASNAAPPPPGPGSAGKPTPSPPRTRLPRARPAGSAQPAVRTDVAAATANQAQEAPRHAVDPLFGLPVRRSPPEPLPITDLRPPAGD